MSPDTPQPVIYFDGSCRLCNRAARWIARRDPGRVFRFAWLESPGGQQAIRAASLDGQGPGSLVLAEGSAYFIRSEAALRIAARLKAPWRFLTALRIIPRPVRDAAYTFIARHRYRWFGRFDSCPRPDATLRDRFVE